MKRKWTMTMSIKVVRRLILMTLILVVFSNLAIWVGDIWAHWVGFLWGICAAVVAFICRAKATKGIKVSKQYYLWLTVPAVLAIVPMVLRIRKALQAQDVTWWDRGWELAPLFVSFIIPVTLLWLAYSGLEGHLAGPDTPIEKGEVRETQAVE